MSGRKGLNPRIAAMILCWLVWLLANMAIAIRLTAQV